MKHLRLWIFECREPSHEAFLLGLAAAALLGLAHVIVNLLGGCNCFCSQEELQKASPNRQLSVACFIFTWYKYMFCVLNSFVHNITVCLVKFSFTCICISTLSYVCGFNMATDQDHTSRRIVDAGDRDVGKRQVKSFVRI